MTPRDPAVTSRIMSAVKNRDTTPEMLLRRELYRRGFRYRVRSPLVGKPDLIFLGARIAVFIDGDWWHGNSWRLRGYADFDSQFDGMSNGEFWRSKITKNIERDVLVTRSLQADGWRVLRFWESDVLADLAAIVDNIASAVHGTNAKQRSAGG